MRKRRRYRLYAQTGRRLDSFGERLGTEIKRAAVGNGQRSRNKYFVKLWGPRTTSVSYLRKDLFSVLLPILVLTEQEIKELAAFGNPKLLHLG